MLFHALPFMVRNYNPCSKNYRKLQPMRTTNTDTNYFINYDGLATLAGWLAGWSGGIASQARQLARQLVRQLACLASFPSYLAIQLAGQLGQRAGYLASQDAWLTKQGGLASERFPKKFYGTVYDCRNYTVPKNHDCSIGCGLPNNQDRSMIYAVQLLRAYDLCHSLRRFVCHDDTVRHYECFGHDRFPEITKFIRITSGRCLTAGRFTKNVCVLQTEQMLLYIISRIHEFQNDTTCCNKVSKFQQTQHRSIT